MNPQNVSNLELNYCIRKYVFRLDRMKWHPAQSKRSNISLIKNFNDILGTRTDEEDDMSD
jgi:hypothetical protein